MWTFETVSAMPARKARGWGSKLTVCELGYSCPNIKRRLTRGDWGGAEAVARH